MKREEKCAECGQPLTPESAYAREGDDGWEYVCQECRWDYQPRPQVALPVCAKGDSCPLAQIVADFIRRLEEEEALTDGDVDSWAWKALHEKGTEQ